MAKYFGRDGIRKGKIGREIFYYAFESNLIKERPIKPLSPNTKKNIKTKGKFGSIVKFCDYCLNDSLMRFFPLVKGAKMKRASIIKTNKDNFLAMHRQYYKISSMIGFGDLKLPGNTETKLLTDTVTDPRPEYNQPINGLLVDYNCEFHDNFTVKSISTSFLDTYPDFQEGYIVHMYGTFCENCFYKNDQKNPMNVGAFCEKKYVYRSFKLDKNDSRKITDLNIGYCYEEEGQIIHTYKIIIFPKNNKYRDFPANILLGRCPGSLYFWITDGNNNLVNNGNIAQIDNFPCGMIKSVLKSDICKKEIEKSWKVEDAPIINE